MQPTKAFMSYKQGERKAEARWCHTGFNWWTGAEVDKDAQEALQEAQRILAVSEQTGHLKGYASLAELRGWDSWSWGIDGASNDGRVGNFLAEALQGFLGEGPQAQS